MKPPRLRVARVGGADHQLIVDGHVLHAETWTINHGFADGPARIKVEFWAYPEPSLDDGEVQLEPVSPDAIDIMLTMGWTWDQYQSTPEYVRHFILKRLRSEPNEVKQPPDPEWHEVHQGEGPVEKLGIKYKTDACGWTHGIAPGLGQEIAQTVREFLGAPELTPDEKLRRGIWSINRYRDEIGEPQAKDTDEPIKLHKPHVGDFVHGVTDVERACRRAVITAVDPNDDMSVDLCVLHENGPYFKSNVMPDQRHGYWDIDCKTYRTGTWHWPCDGDKQPTEAEPDAPTPTAFTVNIQGNTVPERELRDLIEERLRSFGRSQTWQPYRRH